MKLALITRRGKNSLRIAAAQDEWDDLQAAVAGIKRNNLPVDDRGAARIAEALVERGYSGELTTNTPATKEWTLKKK